MTRWRVDFRVKSDIILARDEKEIVFSAPDGSYKIHLLSKTGVGQHAADALYLSAHVILDHSDAKQAGDEARTILRRFLDVLAVATNGYYRIEERILVVDWSPGLAHRRFLLYRRFPSPNVPLRALTQSHLDSVAKLMANTIPRNVRLAIRWWANGVAASPASDQFQYFWYALEILAEHGKPTVKVASKCPYCTGELYCPACSKTPLHRPYPKQAIAMLIKKHVTGQPDEFFKLIDGVRNRLLHGDDPKDIERELPMKWEELSDALGKATWAALLSTLVNITAANATAPGTLDLVTTNTYAHYEMTVVSDVGMSVAHANQADPQIDEFQPELKVDLIVREPEKVDGATPHPKEGRDG